MKNNKPLASRSLVGFIAIVAPQIFSFALAMDIYAPSIPTITHEFAVSQTVMQLTISLFLLMTGIGQILIGPICDQIGRRKIVLASTLIFIIGSLLCMIAPNVTFLIVSRIIQAIGACGMMVSAFAIVRDIFSGDECARVYSFLNSTIALSPLLAPLAGGYLQYYISWRASFALLAIIGLIFLISAFRNINETLAIENQRELKKDIFMDYWSILKSRSFLIYTFCAAAGFAGFLTFFSSSAYVIIDLLKIPEQHFGFYFGAIGIVFFIGSLISGHAAKKLGTFKTVLLGALLMTLSGLVMLYSYWHFGLSVSAFMGPMMIMGIGGAMLMGGGAGGAIEPFPSMAGRASALFGSIEFVFAFIVSQIVLIWKITSTDPLGTTLAILGIIASVALVLNYKNYKNNNNPK